MDTYQEPSLNSTTGPAIDSNDDLEAQTVEKLNYYAVLNLDHNATEEEIKASYKRLCMIYHPDKHPSPDNKISASKRFQIIQKAFDILGDHNTRYIYDLYGEDYIEIGWDLGPKLKSKEEIREEFERRATAKRIEETQNLVKSKVSSISLFFIMFKSHIS